MFDDLNFTCQMRMQPNLQIHPEEFKSYMFVKFELNPSLHLGVYLTRNMFLFYPRYHKDPSTLYDDTNNLIVVILSVFHVKATYGMFH